MMIIARMGSQRSDRWHSSFGLLNLQLILDHSLLPIGNANGLQIAAPQQISDPPGGGHDIRIRLGQLHLAFGLSSSATFACGTVSGLAGSSTGQRLHHRHSSDHMENR